MTPRRGALSLIWRIPALAMLSFVVLAAAAQFSSLFGRAPSGSDGTGALPAPPETAAMFVVPLFCLLLAAAFAWAIWRSRLTVWRLVGATFLAHFGMGTFLLQVETAAFMSDRVPPGFLTRMFVMGGLFAAGFAPLAAWLIGRARPPRTLAREAAGAPLRLTSARGLLRVAALSLAYVLIYHLAGYYIAFRNPELVAYYGGVDPATFFGSLRHNWEVQRWIYPLQAFRGVLWVLCVAPFAASFDGRPAELPPLVGSLYAVWFVMLLLPNPLMPESVRLSHLLETVPSMLLFGALVGIAFLPAPVRGGNAQSTLDEVNGQS
jgi:hypothetical protein